MEDATIKLRFPRLYRLRACQDLVVETLA